MGAVKKKTSFPEIEEDATAAVKLTTLELTVACVFVILVLV